MGVLELGGLFTAALAYMNPGTGSMILQMILVGIAGGYVIMKNAWQTIRALVARRRSG